MEDGEEEVEAPAHYGRGPDQIAGSQTGRFSTDRPNVTNDPSPLERLAAIGQEQVQEAEKASEAAGSDVDLMTLAEEFALLDGRIKDDEAELKLLKQRREELRKQVIPDRMKALGMVIGNKGNFSFALGKIHLETRLYTSIEDKEAAFKWLRDNNAGDLIVETVSGSAMGALVREIREEGGELPPGVAAYEETAVKFSAARSKKK